MAADNGSWALPKWAVDAGRWAQQPQNAALLVLGGTLADVAAWRQANVWLKEALAAPDSRTFYGRRAIGLMKDLNTARMAHAIKGLPETGSLPTGSVVELGFGAGDGLDMLAGKYSDRAIVGVDFSADMVETVAAAKAATLGDRLKVQLGDVAAGLDMPAASAALVFNMNCVYFWSDLCAGCTEVARITAPGGLAATVMLPAPVASLAGGPFKNIDPVQVVAAFQATGFRVEVQVVAEEGGDAVDVPVGPASNAALRSAARVVILAWAPPA